jgi:transcriptional regulator with XRE-family HTH domain
VLRHEVWRKPGAFSMDDALSSFIRDRRGEMSREALAARAREVAPAVGGLHRTAIERWEKGIGGPDAGQLEALFRALGVSDEDRLDVLRRSAGEGPDAAAEA